MAPRHRAQQRCPLRHCIRGGVGGCAEDAGCAGVGAPAAHGPWQTAQDSTERSEDDETEEMEAMAEEVESRSPAVESRWRRTGPRVLPLRGIFSISCFLKSF